MVRTMVIFMGRFVCFGLRKGKTGVPGLNPSSVPVYHPIPSARPGGDQLLITESTNPCLAISDKAIRAKGPIIYKDNNLLWSSLSHNLALQPLGLSYS